MSRLPLRPDFTRSSPVASDHPSGSCRTFTMTSEPGAHQPPTRISVPAGLFAPTRRPAFEILDAVGAPVEIDATWLDHCEGEEVRLAMADAGAMRDYLRQHLPDIVATEAVPLTDRAWAVHRALLHEIALLFDHPGSRGNALQDACRILGAFMHAHFHPDALFRGLRVEGPERPAVHGVETAIGAVAIALADGQHNVPALASIACAGAMADAGILDLPAELRDRDNALTPIERRATYRHPELSLRRMQGHGIVAPEAVRAVRDHHERWDGRGYPARVAGAAIPIEARYVAIADTYSALTVARRGLPRLSRGDALREMAGSTGQFDPSLLRNLVLLLSGMEDKPAA